LARINAFWSAVPVNSIQSGANDSFLGGGYDNNIDTNDTYSVLGGGQQNNIQLGGVSKLPRRRRQQYHSGQ